RLLGRLSNNSDASVCRPSFVALLSELEWRFGQSGHGPARQLSCLSTGLLDGYLRPAGRLSAWLAEPALSSRARVCCLLSPTESTDAVQILPSGLEARSDAPGFETAVAACSVGIGWASTDTPLLRDEGLGVGDDAASVAIDGCRCCLWHRGRQDKRRYRWRRWRVGDVVGCLLEFSANQQQQQQPQSAGGWAAARFSLNGP
uniref:SPRY domain-containing protein n=1 Tax=Macrostomum lignano TaxID=282301 RepID=A0A1I8JHY3_9PLAT